MCSGIPDCFSQRPDVGAVPCGSHWTDSRTCSRIINHPENPGSRLAAKLFVLPLLLYCFGVVADIMAFWISTGGSVFSTGDHIWYPVAPNSPSDVTWYRLYGIPAVIFMAGYLIRLAIRKRVAYHVSEPNDPSENIIR